MKLPFVSRLAYEAERDRRLACEARLDRLADRNDQLHAELLSMKRQGYEPQPAPAEDLPPGASLPLAVEEALDSLGLGPADHAREAARLHAMLDAGSAPSDVIRNLYEGSTHG